MVNRYVNKNNHTKPKDNRMGRIFCRIGYEEAFKRPRRMDKKKAKDVPLETMEENRSQEKKLGKTRDVKRKSLDECQYKEELLENSGESYTKYNFNK